MPSHSTRESEVIRRLADGEDPWIVDPDHGCTNPMTGYFPTAEVAAEVARRASGVACWIEVDLTGSKLGPAWKSVRVSLDFLSHWSDDYARDLTAKHYGVPVEQVGAVEIDEALDA